jgi:metallo-beta-lactamase family protein
VSNRITFHGAAETVTGSRHLIETGGKRILVDCGLFQGREEIRDRNWQPFPIDPRSIDAVVLTHAHNDHIGYLPKLAAIGYKGPVYATPGSIGIARIVLPDSARLQEEDARYRNKIGVARHLPAEPLYTEEDAYAALKLLQSVHYYDFHDLPGGATFRFLPAGHILGSAFAEIYFANGERILMGGDLGRYDTPIIVDPTSVEFAEHLVIESTYGDRLHSKENVQDQLARVFARAMERGSCVLVPSFAIGRTQELLYHICCLQEQGRMPRIPIFVDSPMATSATLLYAATTEDHDKEMKIMLAEGVSPLKPALIEFVRDTHQSKAINSREGPMIVIAGSGMANGGRILHHLKQRLDDPRTILLFTGYQAEGTLGRRILDGALEVRIYGQEVSVRAEVERLESLSAHADYEEMLKWLGGFKAPPKTTFLVHGEPPAQASLKEKIETRLGWRVIIPRHGDSFLLA